MNVGDEFGPSEWLEIDAGADRRASRRRRTTSSGSTSTRSRPREGPFGTTIAHGFLTLSLLVRFWYEVGPAFEGYSMGINYGLNKVRFPAPVPVGSRVRGRFTVAAIEEIEGGIQVVLGGVAEREGQEKPVCAAELVFRQYR